MKVILIICTLFFLLLPASYSQVRKFRNLEVIALADGVYVEILSCRGEGANEECDVIYYTDVRQNGKRFWKLADLVRAEESAAKKLRANENKTLGKKESTINDGAKTNTPISKPAAKIAEQKITSNKPKAIKTILPQKDSAVSYYPNKLQKPAFDTVSLSYSTDSLQPVPASNQADQTVFLKEDTLNGIGAVKSVIANYREPKKLSVFIDCKNGCDMNFIRTELTVVDFLLDMSAADVHILINDQATGGGGNEVQLIFYGQHNFKNMLDTIMVGIPANSTGFERRAEILRGIKNGLFQFLLKTTYAKYLEVKITLPDVKSKSTTAAAKDPWNYWVFTIGADGSFNSDEVYKSLQGSGYVIVNRTTDKLKINFTAAGDYNKYEYTYDDNGTATKFEVLNSDLLFEHSLIASIGNHWGVGYQAAYSNSTFSNNKRRLYGKAAVEYSIFPYKDVNTRFFTVSYGVDVRSNTYFDTTIFFKTSEVLFGQKAQANLSLNQKWGTIKSAVAYSSYFKDASLNNLSARLEFNIRITGGLSIYLYSSGARVRDQVYLVKGKASEQDVLTRRRQIASSYNFYSGMGLNFRFGSKLNNFVNPRLKNL